MDIEELHQMSGDPLPEGAVFDVSKTHYVIVLLPPSIDWPQETFACVVHTPSFNFNGGAIRAFNLNKSIAGNLVGGQTFFNSSSRLLRAFNEFVLAIMEKRHGKLVWEGNINGYNTQVRSFYESPWFN